MGAVSDKVFRDNKLLSQATVLSTLKKDLNVAKVHIIPKAPYDYTGHADGMVRFLDDEHLLVADYTDHSIGWKRRMDSALRKTGYHLIPFPNEMMDEKNDNGDYTARGVYINFAQIGNHILFPQFGLPTDDTALRYVEALYPDCKIIPVPSNDIAQDGGILNCISWNINKNHI